MGQCQSDDGRVTISPSIHEAIASEARRVVLSGEYLRFDLSAEYLRWVEAEDPALTAVVSAVLCFRAEPTAKELLRKAAARLPLVVPLADNDLAFADLRGCENVGDVALILLQLIVARNLLARGAELRPPRTFSDGLDRLVLWDDYLGADAALLEVTLRGIPPISAVAVATAVVWSCQQRPLIDEPVLAQMEMSATSHQASPTETIGTTTSVPPALPVAGADATHAECSICFEKMTPRPLGPHRTAAACGHIFHSRCLERWLARACTCPVCRRPLDVAAARAGGAFSDERWDWRKMSVVLPGLVVDDAEIQSGRAPDEEARSGAGVGADRSFYSAREFPALGTISGRHGIALRQEAGVLWESSRPRFVRAHEHEDGGGDGPNHHGWLVFALRLWGRDVPENLALAPAAATALRDASALCVRPFPSTARRSFALC